ncbi:MAG TPA: NAD-dependent malic enzyme [Opitutaceae bacterium]|jgi:malate dehydrogenase (oxaloacetate-decarboxylating)(NADP+)|nr:NAD-dependent malic enzyme [Opitutaceae bacterium]HOD48009.1 NAD-dependent malic enzyme [Opitutaceae bacterium]HOF10744.1 NAD-dependent malic enzyme [Opitutaceae bacterium]HOR26099.1 NAD-dependent malic enzyme [Opitutaceae bacterium]HPK49918.1 NAD-dependent malic enzyme [Opitutaceae bacterium]
MLPLTSSSGINAHGGPILPHGNAIMNNSLLNKGTAFTEAERDALGLRGLLPPQVMTIEQQLVRALGNFRRKADALEKYVFLTTLQNRNETLFYRLVQEHAEEMIPIIYTPTVGQACLEYGAIFRRPRGLFISIKDKGRIAEVLRHWPIIDVRMIVVTDGERILGLGDLGALGMGIPVGKLALYTACAGLHPYYTLPITLDVGTDNVALHDDPLYIGLHQKRVRGAEYDEFIEEFVQAVKSAYPKALIQWEDFGNTTAFHILRKYEKQVCSFNDDIQGTASVAVAGILSALRLTGGKLTEQKILFQGAGEAGTGIADLFTAAAQKAGLTEAQARACCWFVDSQGLVVKNRPGKLAEHKVPYAHDAAPIATLAEAVEKLRPTILVGVSGQGKAFTQAIVTKMAEINKHPVIFALSNPTSKAECTAEEAYQWTDGRAIFASGSPFAPVTYKGKTFVPGQGNNVYIFPGVGLGALACESKQITNGMFLTAAETLSKLVTQEDLDMGRIYPSLTKILEVSAKIAAAVLEECHREGLARLPRPADVEADIRARMFKPEYRNYV